MLYHKPEECHIHTKFYVLEPNIVLIIYFFVWYISKQSSFFSFFNFFAATQHCTCCRHGETAIQETYAWNWSWKDSEIERWVSCLLIYPHLLWYLIISNQLSISYYCNMQCCKGSYKSYSLWVREDDRSQIFQSPLIMKLYQATTLECELDVTYPLSRITFCCGGLVLVNHLVAMLFLAPMFCLCTCWSLLFVAVNLET